MNMSKLAGTSASVAALAVHEGLRGRAVHSVRVADVKERLIAANGGYEIVHESPGLELGVYVVAPEPDRWQTNDGDDVYVVLEGTGVLEVEGEPVPIAEGAAVYVEAGAERRFTVYEQLSVLVICDRREDG